MYKPLFSVILPTYNRCYILWRAVLSVLRQTYPFFELIIIDDSSKDQTEKLVKTFSDPRIKYIKLKKNQGAPAARNQGLKKARGQYIAYIDSDNRWHQDFLESMKKAVNKYPDKVLFFCKKNYRLKLKEKDKEVKMVRDEFFNHKKYFDLKRLWQRKIIIDTNTFIHKKEIIKKVGDWEEKLTFWEDFEYTLRISKKYPDGFIYLNRALVDYEQTLDFTNVKEEIKRWEKAEEYIYSKHKDHPLIKEAQWYPPSGYKSTGSVIKFLQNKKP
ncbi:MAG: glycosyltransferase family 2 protein [Patescibacteria group bacterium]|nr:glycosyltransferase family 2 protein [Patescibacteria group bacterium]